MTETSGEGAKSIKAMREALGSAARAGDFDTIFQMLDAQGDCLPVHLQVYFRALAFVRTGRPTEALEVLENGPENQWNLGLLIGSLINAGQIGEAGLRLSSAELKPHQKRGFLARLAHAAFVCGDYGAAAYWGLKFREAAPRPMLRFNADVSSLILIGDVEAVRERLPLCSSNQAAILGHALREAAVVLDRRVAEGKKSPIRPSSALSGSHAGSSVSQDHAECGTAGRARISKASFDDQAHACQSGAKAKQGNGGS